MKTIDLLSQPPSNIFSIFSEQRNKTRLGGCFFIIEIIAIIAIIFIFLFDHYSNDSYRIEYSRKFKTGALGTYDNSELLFDQEIKFNFDLVNGYYTNNKLSDNFTITDFDGGKYKNRDYRENGVISKPSGLYIAVYYKCFDNNVCKHFERGDMDYDYIWTNYDLVISYPGFEIHHQNKEKPIQDTNGPLTYRVPFLFDTVTYTKLQWSVIKYEEETGMWSSLFSKYILKKDPASYIRGYIKSSSTFPIEIPDEWKINSGQKLLAIIKMDFDLFKYYEYDHYIRTENSVFITIANIAALISTTNFILITLLKYYSRNYDNYKIIRYLTTKKNLQKNEKLNNLDNKNNKDDLILNKELKEFSNNIENKNESNEDLIKKDDNNELLINEIDPELENAINKRSNKINFIYFFLNTIYCDCCKRNKIEDMISVCNEILDKYLSIDNLLYNQIILENILKDYKWNDSSLNGIKNNELIIKYTNLR